jgi:hypothetical protein
VLPSPTSNLCAGTSRRGPNTRRHRSAAGRREDACPRNMPGHLAGDVAGTSLEVLRRGCGSAGTAGGMSGRVPRPPRAGTQRCYSKAVVRAGGEDHYVNGSHIGTGTLRGWGRGSGAVIDVFTTSSTHHSKEARGKRSSLTTSIIHQNWSGAVCRMTVMSGSAQHGRMVRRWLRKPSVPPRRAASDWDFESRPVTGIFVYCGG